MASSDSSAAPDSASRADPAEAPSAGSSPAWSLAWLWVPTLYFAEGVPNQIVASLSGDMYALLGVSNQQMALWTSWLYLPWVIKPLWSPLVDVLSTQRRWVLGTQALIALALGGVALALPTGYFFFVSLAFFALIAFGSATHDIAADGFYLAELDEKQQAWFVGIRSAFYRGSMFFVMAVLLYVAGELSERMPKQQAWAWTFVVAAAVYGGLALYHGVALPPQTPRRREGPLSLRGLAAEFAETVVTFFAKPGVGVALAYLLLYRFAEAQLGKIARPFMFAPSEEGGLALSEQAVSAIYGTYGLAMLTVGGIVGGIVIAKHGLRRWLLPMAMAINLPNLVYLMLAINQPAQPWVVGLGVSLEMLGYGFGFTAYMMYMIRVSRGPHETAHFALCTGLMALGMMAPQMFSGAVQEWLGYEQFFAYIMLATLPSFAVTALVFRQLKRDE